MKPTCGICARLACWIWYVLLSLLAAILSWLPFCHGMYVLSFVQVQQARAKANFLQVKVASDRKVGKDEGAEVDMSDGVFDVLGYLPRAVFEEQ